MSDISKIDKNFKLDAAVQRDGAVFYNVTEKPFSVHGLIREDGAWTSEVLKYIALVLKTSLRESDILARYGGEEFILFLPHTSPTEGWHVAERLRTSVEQSSIFSNEKTLNVTISLGLSNSLDGNLSLVIKEADTALYESKTTGRNKTTLYTPNMKDYHKPQTDDTPQSTEQNPTE